MKLRSEFGFSGDFAPDDETDPMLAEADDAIRDGMAFCIVHGLLLRVKFQDCLQRLLVLLIEHRPFL